MNRSMRKKGLQILDRTEGCLVGLAVGDALGGPLQDTSQKEISNRFGVFDEMIGGGCLNLKPGETSDDTAQAEMTANSIIGCGGVDPDDIAFRFAQWYQSDGRGAGKHTSRVLARISAGEDWEQTALEAQATNPKSAGNGSLIRSVPVALHRFSDEGALIRETRLTSRITHAHANCQWACVFLNLIICELLAGSDKFEAFNRAYLACKNSKNVSREVLERALMATTRPEGANLSSTGFVLDTLECSLWAWLQYPSFEESVVAAVNLGGGTDTMGAVTGALAGSTYGVDAIPKRWLIYIRNRSRLQELAHTLAGIQ